MKKLIILSMFIGVAILPVMAQQMSDDEVRAAVGRSLREQQDIKQNLELQKEVARINWTKQLQEQTPPVQVQKQEEAIKYPENKFLKFGIKTLETLGY